MAKAVDLIRASKKPLILAGQGVIQSNAMKELRAFAEKIDAPVTVTLLGIGGVPASPPPRIWVMGKHGEALGNHAIHETDPLPPFCMRFHYPGTRHFQTYPP